MIKYKLPEVDKTSRPGDTVEKGSASIPRGAPTAFTIRHACSRAG